MVAKLKMIEQKKNRMLYSQALYEQLLGPILSKDEGIDAEQLTQFALTTLGQISKFKNWPIISNVLDQLKSDLTRSDTRLEQQLFSCHFSNPIGLAAGFDKNGVAASIWDRFGFGFAEIGTVTFHPQEGNPKPRLFRLAYEQGALNRMGFNNNGAEIMKRTLQEQILRKKEERPAIIGINLGKSKITPIEEAPKDYLLSLQILGSFADYAVINVSSPNTPGLRKLQEIQQLRRLISQLKILPFCPPLLVKIAPDLNDHEIDELAQLVEEE